MSVVAQPPSRWATGEVARHQGDRAQALLDPLESPNRNNSWPICPALYSVVNDEDAVSVSLLPLISAEYARSAPVDEGVAEPS